MKKIALYKSSLLLVVVFLLFCNISHAQIQIFNGQDTTTCVVPITLVANIDTQYGSTSYSVDTIIPYAIDSFNTGTLIPVGAYIPNKDDGVTGALPIGFTFCFFGINYTDFYVGTNGWISFSPGQPNAWMTVPIPDGTGAAPKNAIMGPWQDWVGGDVYYEVYGTAPNRRLVVSWYDQLIWYNMAHGWIRKNSQITIYETTNIIKNLTEFRDSGLIGMFWDGYIVQGIQDSSGTTAFTIPGRNYVQYLDSMYHDGWQYTPNAITPPTVYWYQGAVGVPIDSGLTAAVSPPLGVTSYIAEVIYNNCGFNAYDTIDVTYALPGGSITASNDTSICQGDSAQLSVSGGATYLWTPGASLSDSTIANPVASPTVTTTYYVTENSGSCAASGTDMVIVTVRPLLDATITPAGPFCPLDVPVNLTAVDTPGVWSGTGITDTALGTFDPATAGIGTHLITYTITDTCGTVDTMNIVVVSAFDATITPVGPFCPADPALNLTAVEPGGTWSGTGITDIVLGTFDPFTAGTGSHQIIYTIPGACGDADTINITVDIALNATITSAGPFCPRDTAMNLTAADPGGTWSGTGITNSVLGTFDPAVAGTGTHSITYTLSGACGDTDATSIMVSSMLDPTIDSVSAFCLGDPSVILTAADPGGSWTGNGIIDGINGTFNPVVAGAGSHLITYTIAGSCGGQDIINLDVDPCTIFIPNTFTPNEDFENDIFYVRGLGIGIIDIKIYNRWGERVFDADNQSEGWNGEFHGKLLDPGVFAYIIIGAFVNGEPFNFKGNLTLLR